MRAPRKLLSRKGVKCSRASGGVLPEYQQGSPIGSTNAVVHKCIGAPEALRRRYLARVRYQQSLLVAACAAAITLGCRKDKDSEPPAVRITAPGAGFSVNIPDTITVGVAVSDNERVKSLSVLLTDASGVPIAAPVAVPVDAPSRQLTIGLPLTDERIASGTYILTAVADDGANTARDFLSITVQAAPLRLRALYLVPPPSQPPPCIITQIDSTGSASAFITLNELAAAAIDLDHLYTCGTASEPLRRWGLGSGNAMVLAPNAATHPNYFSALRLDPADGRLYACTADGLVRGFNASGSLVFSAALSPGFIGEATAAVGGNLICAAVHPATQQRLLVKHGYATGARLAEFSLAAAPVELFARGEQHVLLFGNNAEGGVILEVNTELGGSFAMRAFPGEALACVARFAEGRYVLGFASGIRRFDYQSNAVTTIVPGIGPSGLTFDPVSGAVLAAHGAQVTAFHPVTGVITSTQSAPHPVGRVLLRLNR